MFGDYTAPKMRREIVGPARAAAVPVKQLAGAVADQTSQRHQNTLPAISTTMRFYAALTLAACLAPAAAIFEDDAYHIDFHYALLGLPKHEATFFQKPYAGSKASLLYSISHNQTIGAINPKDGALVWRQHFSTEPHVQGHLRAGSEQDTVISAVGERIAAWSASDGRLVWETNAPGAVVEDLEILEQEDGMTINEAKDAIILLSGATHGVKRLDGKTGLAKWTFEDTRSVMIPHAVRLGLT
jgi:outer membrane protein assembly factor BamB